MSEKWLNCEVEDGMFSDENVVAFTTVDNEKVSFFVPRTAVQNGRLKVRVFEDQSKLWVVLPTEDRVVVAVKREAVAASAS